MSDITKYEPRQVQEVHKPATQALTRHQRATLYFKAVRMVHTLLAEVGFQDVIQPSHATWSMDFHGFNLEVAVTEPPRIAHVTSYPGYHYDPEKITAKVEMITMTNPGEYVIRLIGVGTDGWSTTPQFVVIRPDSPDPLREAFVSVLHSIHALLKTRPHLMSKIKEAMSRRDIQAEFDRLNSQGDVGQTGAGSGKAVGRSVNDSGYRSIGPGNDNAITI